MKIIKRNGAEVAFDPAKITAAITAANNLIVLHTVNGTASAAAGAIAAPILFASVIPLSMTMPSIWWNMGEWVASASSLRNTRPGASMQKGG